MAAQNGAPKSHELKKHFFFEFLALQYDAPKSRNPKKFFFGFEIPGAREKIFFLIFGSSNDAPKSREPEKNFFSVSDVKFFFVSSQLFYDAPKSRKKNFASFSGLSKGVGFVRFDKKDEAEIAIKTLNGSVPTGCAEQITVKFANNPASNNPKGMLSELEAVQQAATLVPLSTILGAPTLRAAGGIGPIHHASIGSKYRLVDSF